LSGGQESIREVDIPLFQVLTTVSTLLTNVTIRLFTALDFSLVGLHASGGENHPHPSQFLFTP
jgi:hypothetical protein